MFACAPNVRPRHSRFRAERRSLVRIGPGGSRSLFFWAIGRARRFGGRRTQRRRRAGGRCACTCTAPPGYRSPSRPAACIRRSPRSRKGPRSTARIVAGTSGCSPAIPGACKCRAPDGQRPMISATSAALAASGAIQGCCLPLNTPGKPAQALGGMPASLRVEIHGDLAALERLPATAGMRLVGPDQRLTWDQQFTASVAHPAPCQARQALHGARVAAGAAGCQRGDLFECARSPRISRRSGGTTIIAGSGTPARRRWHRHRGEPGRQGHARSRVQITQAGMQVRRSCRQRTADHNLDDMHRAGLS